MGAWSSQTQTGHSASLPSAQPSNMRPNGLHPSAELLIATARMQAAEKEAESLRRTIAQLQSNQAPFSQHANHDPIPPQPARTPEQAGNDSQTTDLRRLSEQMIFLETRLRRLDSAFPGQQDEAPQDEAPTPPRTAPTSDLSITSSYIKPFPTSAVRKLSLASPASSGHR